ncbi:MAG TPA: TonB-dependent receptor [Gemmatimonadaceae bacterium]|nr:TonB-dependent receptor [Gemmatimonadaceae bacterium]
MKTRVIAVFALLALTIRSAASGQETDTAQLETVVVSASKTPQPAKTLTQPVTVLLGEDLRARGVTRVSDALKEVPGASLVQSGSYGAVTSLFLRGGESRYTKVLIDGVPVNASGGFFDFSHLTTDNIERIEIVRGPSSVLNGADAVTGTVHLFTRKGTGPPQLSVSGRGGTYRSIDLSADASGAGEKTAYSVAAARHSTDGILPFNNQYENGTLSSALRIGAEAAASAGISARYTTAEFHYPTDFLGQPVDSNAYRVQHRLTVALDATRNLSAAVQGRFQAGSNDVADLTEDIAVPFGGTDPEHSAFRSRGYRRNAEARVTFFVPASATFTVGMAYEREHESSTSHSGPVGGPSVQTDSFNAFRRNTAYYSELLGTLWSRLSYTIAGRVDDNSDYDRFSTYRLGGNVAVIDGLRLRASLSNAFNAPAFNQVRPTLYTTGSPSLRPERIRSAEIGVVSRFRDVIELSGGYFNQRFADMIQYVSGVAPTYKGSYANLTSAAANGYEAELRITPSASWRASASYTVVNPRVVEVAPDYSGSDRAGDALIRRPSHSGSVIAAFNAPHGLSFSGALSFVGKRPDTDFSQFPSPRVTLPSYVKTDLSAELPLMRAARGGLTLTARVENLFDERYEDVLRFAAPGRVVFIGGRAVALF